MKSSGSRLAIAVVAAAALVPLAACSSSSDSGSGSGSGKTEITLLVDNADTTVKGAAAVVSAFEKANPDITVKVQLTPWDSYWTKLKTAATGGSAPDTFWMNDANFAQYASGGAIKDLQPMLAKSSVSMSDYVPAQAKAYTYKGDVYGIPKDVDSIALWYNKKLFQEAGVQPPTASWTGDDLLAAAQKLTDPATGVFGIVAQSTDQQSYYTTIPQMGGQVISADKKKSGYDTPEAIKAITFWTDMIN
jgi:multiple sugar transport system substrate-binding protein